MTQEDINRAERFLNSYPIEVEWSLSKTLATYKEWIDPNEDSAERIKWWLNHNGFLRRTQERDVVDVRKYAMAYMYTKLGIGPTAIGRCLGWGYSNVSVSIRDISGLINDRKFLSNTVDIRQEFFLDLNVMIDIIKQKRG